MYKVYQFRLQVSPIELKQQYKTNAILYVTVGVICAAPMGTNWHRAQVVQTYEDIDEYDLKLVDFGGYVHMSGSMLRQIRFLSSCVVLIEIYDKYNFIIINEFHCDANRLSRRLQGPLSRCCHVQ